MWKAVITLQWWLLSVYSGDLGAQLLYSVWYRVHMRVVEV